MERHNERTVGEIVADDFRSAEIFKNVGIDFCCGGKKSLSQTCKEKGIDPEAVQYELNQLAHLPVNYSHNFKDWELPFLCDYIVNTHH